MVRSPHSNHLIHYVVIVTLIRYRLVDSNILMLLLTRCNNNMVTAYYVGDRGQDDRFSVLFPLKEEIGRSFFLSSGCYRQ